DETQLWHDDSIETCRQRLHNLGVNALVIKDGANGCQYSQANSSGEVIAHSYKTSAVANVIDTTAAGDSFNAGFLSQWLVGHSIQQCAHYGNALAGQVIQQQGAIVTVDKSAIESLTL
ncbi:MAG: sugar kinase, partial [Paraglaciecola sp.]|nr:sugar kinase [Paraglaciecola sp.]